MNEHSYYVAQPAAVSSSDHAKRTKYSCKCDATFGRWDDLQHHVRSVCRLSSSSSRTKTAVYTCVKCGKKFNSRDILARHARTVCTVVKEPPSPKRSNRDAVRGLRPRRRTHGRICRGHDGRPLSCRDHVPNERVRVQSRKTGWRGWTDNCRTRPSIGM